MKNWLKLDNAAKIFPSVTNAKRHNLFRLSFELTEEIDPVVLQEALDVTIKRFAYFNVKLKRGIFWYYLEENKVKPLVYEEKPFVLEPFSQLDNRGFLFRVLYYNKRISLEVFHVLTDGFGGSQFLKTLVYNYLLLKGKKIDSEGIILSDLETLTVEKNDSFLENYYTEVNKNRKEVKACHIKGEIYDDDWLSVMTAKVKEEDMKRLCNKYDCSVTQLLTTIIMKVALSNKRMFDNLKRSFQVFIAADLRRHFPSKSLRNFSICIRSKISLKQDLSFEEILKIVKSEVQEELKKENLLTIIASNVKWEKMLLLRITPLFLKEIALKIGYENSGSAPNSFCLSNLGKIDIPSEMKQYVEKITFANGSSSQAPINMGVTKYDNKYFLTFSSTLVDRAIQRDFFRFLSSEGVDITLETNELEV